MRLLFVMLFLLIAGLASGQSNNFALIDRYVLSVKDTSVEMLAKKLTKPYKTEKEKVRAIFRWIAENIAYDVEGYHDKGNMYDGLPEAVTFSTRDDYNREYNRQVSNKILSQKKAICDGYSRLFKTLCDYSNINCEIISGLGRHWDDEASPVSNHAWNAVSLNGEWHLLDATWAAGTCNDSVTKFTKSYNDFYFLTPPGAFINTHFPMDAKWILLDEKPHLNQVYNTVYTYPSFYKSKIKSITPVERTIIITPTNRKVTFELELPPGTVPKHVWFNETPSNISNEPITKVIGNKVICIYEVVSEESEGLFVYYGSNAVLAYKIMVKK